MRPGQRGNRADETAKDSTDAKSDGQNSLASRIEIPSEVTVTAWYTLDIPISQGPGEYWGLPGLILEVSEGRTAILCSKITLNPKEKIPLRPLKRKRNYSKRIPRNHG